MNDCTELAAIEGVRSTKYAYMRCLDTKNWDELATLLAEDVVADWSGGKLHFEGRDAVMTFLVDSMGRDSFLSSHRVHQPEVTLTSETTASGRFAMEDLVVDTQWNFLLFGAAFYEDTFVRADPGAPWQVATVGYLRTFEFMIPTDSIAGYRLTASFWGTGGRSELV